MFKRTNDVKRRLEIEINNVDLSIVNCLRRVIIAEYPTVAIGFDPYHQEFNDIIFKKNTSSLHNEFLGHRISLLPVNISAKNFNADSFTFVINVTNTNSDGTGLWVTTNDIKLIESPVETDVTKIFPPDDITRNFILITKLKVNESVHVTFKARVGISKTHSRWSPISLCTFSNKLDQEKIDQHTRLHPELTKNNKFQTLDKHRMFSVNRDKEPDAFNFVIESECVISPIEIFLDAFDIIIQKLQDMTFTHEILNDTTHLSAIEIVDQDHTIGNLLQALAVNEFIRKKDDVFGLTYIGYFQPHPLETSIIVKVAFSKENVSVDNFVDALKARIIEMLQIMKTTWTNGT